MSTILNYNSVDDNEYLSYCNFCKGEDFRELAVKDHQGLDVRTNVCKRCGLIFINPRPTQQWYKKFYKEGEYRNNFLSQNTDAREANLKLELMFLKGSNRGFVFADEIGSFLKKGLVIDVGSGIGDVLNGFRNRLGWPVLGIEPSMHEGCYAKTKDIETFICPIEEIGYLDKKIPSAANILCVQSLNHFLDPNYFFIWAYNKLEQNGRLVLEVKDFGFQAKKAGKLESAIQIDHPFMFIAGVLMDFVKSAGFDIIFCDEDSDKSFRTLHNRKKNIPGVPGTHIRLVAIKSSRKPFENLFINSKNKYITYVLKNRAYLYFYCNLYKIVNRFLSISFDHKK